FEAWLAELDAAESEVAQRPDLRYLRAQAAVRRDQHAAAIPHLTVLIETDDPEFAARSLRQRAGLNQQLGRTEAAADDYAAFAARFEDHPEAHDAARRAVDLAFRAGRLEQVPQLAADYLRRAEPGDAHAPAVRLRTALALMQLNRGNEALDELAQLLEADPDERLATIAHYYQGLLLASRAQLADDADAEATDPAIAALERALQGPLSDKQRAEAINLTARMHRMAGRESQALDLYDQLRRERSVDTFDPMAALWIGRGLHQRGSYEAALPWLETVIARAEDKPRALAEALYLAGEAHHARGDHDQAVTRFRQVVAYSQGYGDRGRLGLARALAATGEVDEALNEYEGLQHVEASAIAAAALLEGAQHRLALADRLERGGDATNAHAERTEARRQLNRVVILYDLPELGSLPSVAKLRLARLLHDLDRTDDARRRLTELADAVDSKPFRDLARAELTLLEGNRADAISLLRQVHTAAEDEAATAEANQRLQALGESP
ncbi:MAG: tetratricopeptide repeat protein, partial [Phycisphaeraceae bacterium]